MSRPVEVTVEVRVHTTRGDLWMGRGRDLPEALTVVRSYLGDRIPQNERAAMAAALDRGAPRFTIQAVSDARWWCPFTWGTMSLRVSQGARLISGPEE